ncbi:MAG: hypothetical protein J6Q65_03870, partial [Lentisphaeria bacterium]|nr:hypothetical protein [Lentisphaeria bacterium]
DMPVHKYGFYPRQGLNEDGGEEDHNQFQNGGSTSEFKKMRTRIYDPENPGLTGGSATVDITTTEQWKSTSYVAALYDVLYGDFGNSNPLKKDENNSKFWRRTDFLSVDKKRSNAEANVDDILFPIRQNYGDFTDAQEEQIIGRTINLMNVDSTIKVANAILLVQTLKDSGNTTVYRDWNSDGRIESGTLSKEIRNHKLTQHQSGYRRFTDVKDSDVGFYDPPQHSHKEKIRGIKGSYQNGADGISGETKVIISLDFDTATQKWKMVKYEYAD